MILEEEVKDTFAFVYDNSMRIATKIDKYIAGEVSAVVLVRWADSRSAYRLDEQGHIQHDDQ